jgi:NAD(P)-dependent dehydrogenase (short-subunit alcohol dehydrogenase family)
MASIVPPTDSLSLFSLAGKVALVAGASRGIGEAIARGLASAGAEVIAFARSAHMEGPQATRLSYRQCDVDDAAGVRALIEQACGTAGTLHIYVHAAGITIPSGGADQSVQAFEQTLKTNLVSAYSTSMAAAARMASGGSIIHLTSIGAVLGFPNNPGYGAAKAGLRMMTKSLAIDLAERNIRVNAIAPGYIRTAMTEASYRDPQRNAARVARMIIRRWGTPQDLIGAAIFLASDASSYVTGQDLFVDGGWTAKGL